MTRQEIRQVKRNALLVALIDFAVEAGDGEARATLSDGRHLVYRQDDVVSIRQASRNWFSLRDRLDLGEIPPDDRPSARDQADRLLADVESHWPAAASLRDAYLGPRFWTPTEG